MRTTPAALLSILLATEAFSFSYRHDQDSSPVPSVGVSSTEERNARAYGAGLIAHINAPGRAYQKHRLPGNRFTMGRNTTSCAYAANNQPTLTDPTSNDVQHHAIGLDTRYAYNVYYGLAGPGSPPPEYRVFENLLPDAVGGISFVLPGVSPVWIIPTVLDPSTRPPDDPPDNRPGQSPAREPRSIRFFDVQGRNVYESERDIPERLDVASGIYYFDIRFRQTDPETGKILVLDRRIRNLPALYRNEKTK